MNIVWSFWSQPFFEYYKESWYSPRHHLMSWILSVKSAQQFYPDIYLHTDVRGKELLVDTLGLEFKKVFLTLEDIDKKHSRWWALGKLYTYLQQEEPFIHLDSDVYLSKPLSASLTAASLLVQNEEQVKIFSKSMGWYKPYQLHKILELTKGDFPEEWKWAIDHDQAIAYNCGIVGGQDVEFIKNYAQKAIDFIENKKNDMSWEIFSKLHGYRHAWLNILVEQYYLAACSRKKNEEMQSEGSAFNVRTLIDDPSIPITSEFNNELGYTHLLGENKKDQSIADELENIVKKQYPELYERCEQLVIT
jgi:hypothetical protein